MGIDRIVVGVDGSAGALSAVLWAADECRIRNCSLLIVHACDAMDASSVRRSGEAGIRAMDAVSTRLLQDLSVAASIRQPGVTVGSVLSHSEPAEVLLDLGAVSELIVVGSRPGGSNTVSMLGSVSHRLAAHAACPVAVIPPPAVLSTSQPRTSVVVGISSTPAGRAGIDFAFEEASRRGVGLVAVRAWGDADAVGVDDRVGESAEGWRHSAAALLKRDLADVVQAYPDVPVKPLLVRKNPAEALIASARDAELVVVGCHHSDDHWSTRLGPVPSMLLSQAGCPVVVVGRYPGQSNRSAVQATSRAPAPI